MESNYESLVAFAQEIERRETQKNDYVVSTDRVEMINDNDISIKGVGEFKANENFHCQLASHYKIPKTYYNQMEAIPGLRTQNVNAWLNKEPDKRFIRTLDGTSRAFLSDKYRPLDHAFICSALFPILKEINGLEVKSQVISDVRFYLQIVFPKLSGEVAVGDVVQQGIIITNSEVGRGAVDISSVIWRLVCSNGMIGESLLNRRHVGKRISMEEGNLDIFQNDTIKADIEAYRLKMRDVVKSALQESAFEERLTKLREANADVIAPKLVKSTVENVTKRFPLLSGEDGESILANMIGGGNLSRYGLANAVTSLAHEITNPEKAYDVERIGSQIIELKPNEWKLVA